MKTASVRDLRLHFPRIEGWLKAGEHVVITKRRKVVGELSPPRPAKKPDFAKRFGGTPPPAKPGKSIVDLLIEDRGE